MIKKVDVELSISRNFNKITISFKDEEIEYESDEELKAKIRKRFKLIRDEIDLEFGKIQK